MKLAYRLTKVCGYAYSNGNLVFTPDGNSVISPVGNRLTIFDLVHQTTTTLPFENRKNIQSTAISNNGRFLISVDDEGHALFINLPRKVILLRFHFKRKVRCIQFSPDDTMFAATFGHNVQIWRTPSIEKEFAPLILNRTVGGFYDDTRCLCWSPDSQSLVVGSKDLSAKVYYRVKSKHMSMTVLSGHRDKVLGAFYNMDADEIYTVAVDGGVFVWEFQVDERKLLKDDKKEKDELDDNEDEEDEKGLMYKKHKKKQKLIKTVKGSKWVLRNREFLWDPHTRVSSVNFQAESSLLVVGFDNGVFGLYEMPECTNIHRLSVSNQCITSSAINSTGDWLVLGSARMGQLVVWEWKSESFVLKQQGHLYGLNSLDFSSDGHFIVTGGDDAKTKLWNTHTGFCFVTFTEHTAPVTVVKFAGRGSGRVVLSASLDGSVRAHDMLRYKNFRTLVSPTQTQFTTLSVDSSGEVVCAGSLDPFNIYVWALQTGTLLDVLAGHEGPLACLDFSQGGGKSLLASTSWDGTLKIWDVYDSKCIETMEHGCDVLAVSFRPDGQEVCTAAMNGNLQFWDIESGTSVKIIEGRRDISGGRLSTDATTADNSFRTKYFTTVSYTADGKCVIAGGQSKYVCIYVVSTGALIKKFQMSYNRSLDGIQDELRSDALVDGVVVANIVGADDDSDNENTRDNILPGAQSRRRADDGSRTTKPTVLTTSVKFSPTGREFAVATTQGLQIFSLDEEMLFAPTDLDITITPQAVREAVNRCEFGLAINMALHLGEQNILKFAIDNVEIDSIELVVKSLDANFLQNLIKFLGNEIVSSRHIEFYLTWVNVLLRTYGSLFDSASMQLKESLRVMIRAVSLHEAEILKICDENQFILSFLDEQKHCVDIDFSKGTIGDKMKETNHDKAEVEETIQEKEEMVDIVVNDKIKKKRVKRAGGSI